MHYPHTIPPYEHQKIELEQFWDVEYRAIFWEQGLGKMKTGYDWALTLWKAGKIDTMIVISPNGVHIDWVEEGFKPVTDDPYNQPLIPTEWQDDVVAEYYQTGKAGTKRHQQKMKDLYYTKSPKLAVLSMSYDAAKTASQKKTTGWIGGKLFLEKMLRERKCAFILDEASMIQTPSAKITKTLVGYGGRGGLGKHAVSRRIMEGTPVDEGPFNAYTQMQFLHQDFWKEHGFGSYAAFKQHFGIFRDMDVGRSRPIQQLVAYQNLEDLRRILAPYSTRVLKKDALDLPPKVYQHHRFEISPEQRKVYDKLQDELYVMAKAEGKDVESLITAEMPIVNVLKLYQITCGYLPFVEDEDGEPVDRVIEFKENPRFEEAMKFLKSQTGKVIVWCRFTRDIDMLSAALGSKAVRYDGKTDPDQRALNKKNWLQGDAQFLIPQIQAMARGHTLNIAENVLYYSNDSRLRMRRQSEDRTHRGKMKHSVLYTDMLATGTVDEKRIKSLRKKLSIAEQILGDES